MIETIRDRTGKYGRYLATIYGRDLDGAPTNLNHAMVRDGHAVIIS